MVVFQLQRFAGEKTERATPQRRREAREKGQLPRSTDLTAAVSLLAIVIVLRVSGSQIWNHWLQMMQTDLVQIHAAALTQTEIRGYMMNQVLTTAELLVPILGAALVIGVVAATAQTGIVFLPNRLMPDFQRVQPLEGLKRMFSMRTGVEAVKSILKLVVVGILSYTAIRGTVSRVEDMVSVDIHAFPALVGGMIWNLAIQISLLMLFLATLDLLYQRFEFEKSIRMSHDDIREEMKRMEGNPQIKAKVRQRGRELAMRRMMQEVPKADVVITNPTHFAVALKYDVKRNAAPIVIAKGQDEIALKIRSVASNANVPTVENRPLAQTLYRTIDIGQAIPAEFYKAVAEILAHVYRQNGRRDRG